ncbi:hypothetical protein [Spirosoma oryzicola]|uniref:hypothetical protein n=1 Tax=Spirosoma oryzicola TaxID=2898794 RepID=UPI001E2CFF83|nr:hypothetical protein [Spirosoma oryzicola]UHG94710.1 hypothetical protein LQ777_29370 [Spirosoma oryzicola]
MATNSLILSPEVEIEEGDMFSREGDAAIMVAAQHYIEVQNKTSDFLSRVEDRHLSGSPGTVYLKKLGHRPLSAKDFDSIVNAVGSQEDKQAVSNFGKAQLDLAERLKSTKIIGVILEQAEITRDLYYNRAKQPHLWKAEEVIKVMNVLDRLQV